MPPRSFGNASSATQSLSMCPCSASLGRHVPDVHPAPDDPNLTEAEPSEEERPFVRGGWFRGPRSAVVFVYRCPDCGETSRWFRATRPEVTLNPKRWERLCGEQEDLKMWLARYLGIRLRMCCPLDWDHVWTEVFDGDEWVPISKLLQLCETAARRHWIMDWCSSFGDARQWWAVLSGCFRRSY